ncbi:hypothetical protein BHAOGJBA_0558 [Methylobacterium hispanicum]|uniref:ATPase n=1 Tax=Methylobacterium hispanicum TaxID=270350 RepID=A0AAV4ZGK6_9HYPH|nr:MULTISPECIES: ATPase [Methylobacterium]GJD87059.1 hypothetical protein BHAOGJBA_0558 [Methylobacterium hispanicum]
MSEPARQHPPSDAGPRPSSGPLRDWLAAMKAHAPATAAESPPEPARQPARSEPPRPEPGWNPRIVEARAPRTEDPDLSELMAENLMLKAKLDLEAGRQDALEAKLAEEIRALRGHVQEEVALLESFRAERDRMTAECENLRAGQARHEAESDVLRRERDRIAAERDAARMDGARFEAERDALREECDLWRARAEALAQPLFQARR